MSNESTQVVEATIVGQALEVTPTRHAPSRVIGGIGHLDEYMMLADRVSRTDMVPSGFRGKPDQVLAVVLYGAEIGIGPMFALQSINFIEGRPSVSPELMRALIRQAGHRLDITSTRTECVIVGERCDTGETGRSEFTLVDAVAAGLCRIVDGNVQARSRDGKVLPWEKYTKDMLLARATSRIARMMFSDVVAGMSYTPEEIESFTPVKARQGRVEDHSSPDVETGEMASEDQTYALTTSLSLLDENDRATVRARWLEAQLPPLANGLTAMQAERALAIVDEVLNAGTSDAVDAEIVKPDDTKPSHETEPTSNVSLATATQVRAINTILSRRDVVGPGRHDIVAAIIGRRVESLNSLTKDEAATVIDHLKDNESSRSVKTSPEHE
jgi:hypothetical protein